MASLHSFVFNARLLAADVRLRVFDAEFHVHSMILKLHSASFFKYQDSPHKARSAPNSGRFKYEWVTEVDDDGTWGLVSGSTNVSVRRFDV